MFGIGLPEIIILLLPACIALIVIPFLSLFHIWRFANAHKRIADALESIAGRIRIDGKG